MTPGPARATSPPTAGRSLVLPNIDWDTYTKLLRVFAEKPGIRLTYDRGELEIMSPVLEHGDDASLVGDMVFVLTDELGLPLKRGGSTTLRRRRRQRGIEPDECFWIASAPLMAGRRRLDLRTDPPPDLAIEVDVTSSSLDRFAIYANLVVQEVWRIEGPTLTFHVLSGGQYQVSAESRSFPRLRPDDLMPFLQQARQAGDENAVLRSFRLWVRQNLVAPPPTPSP
jgi:Uma2 family endonuclease